MQPESLNTKKIILSAVLLVLFILALWFFFFRNVEKEVILDEFGNPVVAQVVGQDLIDILTELQSVNLDASVLRTAGFLNLTDFGVLLGDEPIGRKNPFERIGG